jgi:multisubunit Na+/H+ antiporter MnhB subunit
VGVLPASVIELALRRARTRHIRQLMKAVVLGAVGLAVAIAVSAALGTVVAYSIGGACEFVAVVWVLSELESPERKRLEMRLAFQIAYERPGESLRSALPRDYGAAVAFAGVAVTALATIVGAVINSS